MLRVFLTGRVSLSVENITVSESALGGRLGRMLLTRLALERHPIDRDRLIEDLWPDGAPTAVDSVLNATFSRLRSVFTSVGLDARDVLRSSGGVAEFRPPSDARVDVITAAEAIDAAEAAARHGATDQAWASAVVAHSIARRPLLPGIERLWLDIERDRLQNTLERSLAVLADTWLQRGDAHQSATMARELIRCAPYSEVAHQRLVVALLAIPDRAAAAHAVGRWEATVADELGLPAGPRLRSLFD
jgi:DNA-binding SARP family transcriptional activator